MNVTATVGLALIGAALTVLLRKYSPEYALPVSAAAGAVILLLLTARGADIFNTIREISDRANIDDTNIRILFKALGIAYIVQLAKDVCTDSGETALANRAELAGRIALAVLALPLTLQVLDIITGLLDG